MGIGNMRIFKKAYLQIIFINLFHFIKTYTFIDGKNSYLQYTQWEAANNGTLILKFKTYHKFGLLLYSDNSESLSSIKNSFVLQLKSGRLSITVQMGDEDHSIKTKVIGDKLNDLQWHNVNVTQNGRESLITLDKKEEILIHDANRSLMLTSGLFVGGVSKSKTENLVNRNILHMPRFIGCIENLHYLNSGTPVAGSVIDRVKVKNGCLNACQNITCPNNGKCINRFTKANCDCIGTGYEGKLCTKVADSIQFKGNEYITIDVAGRQKSTSSDIIKVRFKTTDANGVIFATLGGNDHLMLELHATIIRLSIDLGGGFHISEINDVSFNDGQWHLVEVYRNGRETSISVDRKFCVNSSTPGVFSKFDMRNPLHIGGHPDKRILAKMNSKSKVNFTGCLQQIYYNDMNVIYQLFLYRGDRFKKYGTIKKGCDVVKPKFIRTRENLGSSVSKSGPSEINREKQPPKDTNGAEESAPEPNEKKKITKTDSNSLSRNSIVWITVGLVIGSIVLVITVAVIVHNARNRYRAVLLSSSLKSLKENNNSLHRRFSSNDRFLRGSTDRILRGSTDRMLHGSSDRVFRASTDRLIRGSTDRIMRGSTDRLMRCNIDRAARGSIDRIPRSGSERTLRAISERRLIHSIYSINDRLLEDKNESSRHLYSDLAMMAQPNSRLAIISSRGEIGNGVNDDTSTSHSNDRDTIETHVL